jgi:antitoxin ParD1/3/4
MNVSLTDELEKWIETRVSAGLYRSSSEVVREALRLLREHEELKELQREELRRSIKVGIDDLDAGRSRPLDAAALDQIKAAGRSRLKQAK